MLPRSNGDWLGSFQNRDGVHHGKRQEDQNRNLSSAKKGNAIYGRDRLARRRDGDRCRVEGRSPNPRIEKDTQSISRGQPRKFCCQETEGHAVFVLSSQRKPLAGDD